MKKIGILYKTISFLHFLVEDYPVGRRGADHSFGSSRVGPPHSPHGRWTWHNGALLTPADGKINSV